MEIITAEKPDLHEFLKAQLRAARVEEQKMVCRIQPQVYGADTKQYQGWPDVAWKILIDNLEEAKQLKEALDEFFDALGRKGPEAVIASLRGL